MFAKKTLLFPGAALLVLTSCVTTTSLPLCPDIAAIGYVGPSTGKPYINTFILTQTKRRKIKVNILSPFKAEYSGHKTSIKWFESNYSTLVCAFDPAQEIDDEGVYKRCEGNVGTWISLIKEGRDAELLDDQHQYSSTCLF